MAYVAYNVVILLVFFLGAHPQPMEVPRLGVESELQLLAYTTQDTSHICNLYCSSRQHQILNPLSKACDQIHILMDTSQVCYYWATTGTPTMFFLMWISIVLVAVKAKHTCKRKKKEERESGIHKIEVNFFLHVVDQSRLGKHPCSSRLLATHVPFILLPLGCCTHLHGWNRVTVISTFQSVGNKVEEKFRVSKFFLSNWGVHWPHHICACSTGANNHVTALSFKKHWEMYSLSHVRS